MFRENRRGPVLGRPWHRGITNQYPESGRWFYKTHQIKQIPKLEMMTTFSGIRQPFQNDVNKRSLIITKTVNQNQEKTKRGAVTGNK